MGTGEPGAERAEALRAPADAGAWPDAAAVGRAARALYEHAFEGADVPTWDEQVRDDTLIVEFDRERAMVALTAAGAPVPPPDPDAVRLAALERVAEAAERNWGKNPVTDDLEAALEALAALDTEARP